MAGFRQSLLVGRDAATAIKAVGSGTFTGTDSTIYVVRVTKAGASGAAKVTVYDTSGAVVNAAATVTSGAAITLGAVGARLTLTWSGVDLVVGQEWWAYADTGVNTVGRVEEVSAGNGQMVRFARVNSDGELLVAAGSLATSLALLDDAVYTDGSGTPSKGLLVMGTDGTNPQALKVTTTGAAAIIGEAAATQAITIPAESNTHTGWIDVRGYVPLFGTDTAFAGTDITFLHSFDGSNSAGGRAPRGRVD